MQCMPKDLLLDRSQKQIEDIYGFEVSEGFVSDVTDKLLPKIEEWQQHPLAETYPIVFIDAGYFSVKDNHIIRKLAAYVILGVTLDGYKEVLSIQVGQNESSKYWFGVLNLYRSSSTQYIKVCS